MLDLPDGPREIHSELNLRRKKRVSQMNLARMTDPCTGKKANKMYI